MAMLTDAGFECELLAAEPERPNLVARLRGSADGPTLAYLGHVDTVRADAAEWTRDPWGGDLVDGWVWGRGALDMKGQVASELAAALELGRSGWRPAAGELLLVITADEEAGGDLGARWLCEQHPDKVRCDFVVNEGGGSRIDGPDGRRLYTLSVGEKGIFRAQLRVSGRAGHASLPKIGDNALLKLAPLIARLADQPEPEPHLEPMAFLSVYYGESFEGADGMTRRPRAASRRRAAARLLPGGADARHHAEPDQGPGRRKGERDPLCRRGADRHPRAARARGRRRPRGDRIAVRRGRLRARVQRGCRRQPLRVRDAADRHRSAGGSRRPTRAPSWRRS